MAKKPLQEPRVCLDGFTRHTDTDDKISVNVASLFSSELGKEVLNYLRSITVESVHGTAVTNDALRHIEGQRYIVGVIQARVKHAHKVKGNE